MFAHHACTRVLKVSADQRSMVANSITRGSDINSGMRLEFGLESVEYSYSSNSVDSDMGCFGNEDRQARGYDRTDIEPKDFPRIDESHSHSQPFQLQVRSQITDTVTGECTSARYHKSELNSLASGKTDERGVCRSYDGHLGDDGVWFRGADESSYMPRLQAPRPCPQKSTDLFQRAPQHERAVLARSGDALPNEGGIGPLHFGTHEHTETRNTGGGVNFMLAAHIRTAVTQSTRSRNGAESNPRSVPRGVRRQDICRPVWQRETVSCSSDWDVARKVSGSYPFEECGNLVPPESSLRSRPFLEPQHLVDDTYTYRHDPRQKSTPDRGAVFEQQLAAQQRQIELLQAALHQVQTCVVHSPSRSGGGESEAYFKSVEHWGKKDEQLAKETHADVQTQLSIATNSSFFRVNDTGMSVDVATFRCGEHPMAEPCEGGAFREGPSLSTNQDLRSGPRRPPTHDPGLPMLAVRVGCTDNAEVVSSRTRSGGVGGNGAISIFADELVGQKEAGQGVYAREALNMSYPGAGPSSVVKAAAPNCGMRVLLPDEKTNTLGIDGKLAILQQDCKEGLNRDEEDIMGGGGESTAGCVEMYEGAHWQVEERVDGSSGLPCQGAPPHEESPAIAHEAAAMASAHDRGRPERICVHEKQEPECCSQSAVRFVCLFFLFFVPSHVYGRLRTC